MFQVRSMAEIITCRCVEVEPNPAYLSTEFSYVITSKKTIYVWIGKNCIDYDMQHALVYGERFSKENNCKLEIINENKESREFWNILGGKAPYVTSTYIRNSARLFRCTNDQGFYAIRERYADFCQVDLLFDDVMILDSGEQVFIWIGESASNLEINLTKKLAPVYIEHLKINQIGPVRTLHTIQMGHEPIEFKRVFQGFD